VAEVQLRPEPEALALLIAPAFSTGRLALRVAAVLCTLAVLFWSAVTGLLWASESRLVFNAAMTRAYPQPLDPTLFTTVHFRNDAGIDLEAAILRAPGEDPYWVLFCPPSGRSIHNPRLQADLLQLRHFGYNVLAFDYRGFGATPGIPSEQGLYADARAAYDYITTAGGVPSARIVVAGRSLGSAVAVELARHVRVAGLVLLSPIDSVPLAASRLYPWAPVALLAANRFDSRSKVEQLRVPVLVVHAATDRLIPLSAARELFERIHAPKAMLETTGGHNRAGFAQPDDLERAMRVFWPDQSPPGRR
jgi:uncharacterized protein